MKLFMLKIVFIALSLTIGGSFSFAQDEPLGGLVSDEAPVDLTADQVEHNDQTQIVTASGNVELVQAGRILKADKITYNLTTDTVRATGNVILNEVTGDTYFADDVELTDQMKDGFVEGLSGLLADGSRFWAEKGRREQGTRIVMNDATYTPCDPCEDDPDKAPLWQLRAKEVTHDKEDKRISYKNARFELGGVPVAWTPYFSHPDGSVKRKSGFLTPSLGFDSELGATYEQEYYWNIAPDKDATIGALVTSDEGPLLKGEYRQRFDNAAFEISGGITHSSRVESDSGQNIVQDEEVRGHIFADGLWDINNKWRAGFNVETASDDQYMRQYNFSTKDVLENELYAERFSGRNYADARLIAFQDIRVSDRQTDQPDVLPELYARFLGEPNETLGGRWSAETSLLGLTRDGNGQDLTRGSLQLGWERRHISRFGLVSKAALTARGDAYSVRDRDIADTEIGRSRESSELRGFSQAHFETSYPVVRDFENAQLTIEPVAALTAGTNIDLDNDIPNEDSQDIVVDASNLFEPNRFAGFDRIEDRSKVTYGMRSGLYGNEGGHLEMFLGQSLRLDSDDNPFPEGSGLSEDQSDYVGQVTAGYGDDLDLNYRFQLGNNNFSSQRHEVDANVRFYDRLSLGSRYLYTRALEGTDLDTSREQIQGTASLDITDRWRTFGLIRYDLGDDGGLRRAIYGATYTGQCITLSASAQRSLTSQSSGDSGTEIFFRIGLKNLGEFETSGVSLGGSDE